MLIVTQASAASLRNRHLDPIDANHITIVKPTGASDVPYLAFKAAFNEAPSRNQGRVFFQQVPVRQWQRNCPSGCGNLSR